MYVEAIAEEGESVLGWGYEEPDDGGKATNQAVAAARLGAPVALVTIVGRDARGQRARDYLQREGIDTRWVIDVDGPTDAGFVMLPPSRIPAITVSQDRSRELDEAVVKRAADTIRRAAIVVCQLEAPPGAALAAFRAAREAGARTILNPSPARNLDPELISLTDVLVPNQHEAAALVGVNGAPATLARELAQRWPVGAVIVTVGSEGAYLATNDGLAEYVPAPEVPVVDTTGAGDAFVGALAVQLKNGVELPDACRFAVRAASVSVMRLGTIPAFPRPDDLTSSG